MRALCQALVILKACDMLFDIIGKVLIETFLRYQQWDFVSYLEVGWVGWYLLYHYSIGGFTVVESQNVFYLPNQSDTRDNKKTLH